MKLVFYSGGQTPKNHELHARLFELTGRRSRASFTYVPFCSEGAATFYARARNRYKRFGFTKFNILRVDQPHSYEDLARALESDVIYLAGGNTFYFLHHLKKSRVLGQLKNYARDGGVLAGLSAGGIILTPNIHMAAFPPFDSDENDVRLENLKALGLVKFEFFPHYVNSKRFNESLASYSALHRYPLYAVRDGGGIVVDGDTRTFVGDYGYFFKGMRLPTGF